MSQLCTNYSKDECDASEQLEDELVNGWRISLTLQNTWRMSLMLGIEGLEDEIGTSE